MGHSRYLPALKILSNTSRNYPPIPEKEKPPAVWLGGFFALVNAVLALHVQSLKKVELRSSIKENLNLRFRLKMSTDFTQ